MYLNGVVRPVVTLLVLVTPLAVVLGSVDLEVAADPMAKIGLENPSYAVQLPHRSASYDLRRPLLLHERPQPAHGLRVKLVDAALADS